MIFERVKDRREKEKKIAGKVKNKYKSAKIIFPEFCTSLRIYISTYITVHINVL